MQDPDFLTDRLEALRSAGQFRTLPTQRSGLDFWSNDYLGFSRRISIDTPAETAPGSRLISGNHDSIERLERRIASFHGFPAALLFGSGYTANVGLLSCLARRTDTVIYDEQIHASLRDGIRLSGAAGRRCAHNSITEVANALSRAQQDGNTFVVTESRFSMDGDTAPLAELAALCAERGAHLIVDEAHSTGLDGAHGVGLVGALGLQGLVFATVSTYGKAAGHHGAAVLGAPALRDYLVNFSRPFIFTTGPRPHQVAGLDRVYDLFEDEQPAAYSKLAAVIAAYQSAVQKFLPGRVPILSGPIQWIPVGDNHTVMELEAALAERGFLVKGIRSPSVARGTERLRICLHAFNTVEDTQRLVQSISEALNA